MSQGVAQRGDGPAALPSCWVDWGRSDRLSQAVEGRGPGLSAAPPSASQRLPRASCRAGGGRLPALCHRPPPPAGTRGPEHYQVEIRHSQPGWGRLCQVTALTQSCKEAVLGPLQGRAEPWNQTCPMAAPPAATYPCSVWGMALLPLQAALLCPSRPQGADACAAGAGARENQGSLLRKQWGSVTGGARGREPPTN